MFKPHIVTEEEDDCKFIFDDTYRVVVHHADFDEFTFVIDDNKRLIDVVYTVNGVKNIEVLKKFFGDKKKIFNLGFRERGSHSPYHFCPETVPKIIYKIYRTIFSTIPFFLEKKPDSIVLIQGSDEEEELEDFTIECKKIKCLDSSILRKNCDIKGKCLKFNQILNLYSGFVARYSSKSDYNFYGSSYGKAGLNDYVKYEKYETILISK